MKIIKVLHLVFVAAPIAFGQVAHVTHGQEPKLPAPFTKPIVANPPQGRPENFLNGFDPNPHAKDVDGRPVGVAVAKDGSLPVSDDVGNVIWRVSKK